MFCYQLYREGCILVNRSDFFVRALVTVLFSYGIAIGATFNGILSPDFPPLTFGLTAIVLVIWLVVRWKNGWKWHPSPLDYVFGLWVIAFMLSLLTNLDVARRIGIGLWYMGLYFGVWYVLHDSLANRTLRRDVLVDGLLISGFVVMLFGFLQLGVWLGKYGLDGATALGLPRPVSTFGNPNFLGNFLVVIIPFALSRAVLSRNLISRMVMWLYVIFAVSLLFLTFSRGAWIGIAIGLLVWGLLFLASHDLLSYTKLRSWWNQQSGLLRIVISAISLAGIAAGIVVMVIFVRSLSQAGRDTGLRTEIYRGAVELFLEKPIAGQGLFTFGRGLVRLSDVNPDRPHSHAHEIILQVAAEMGIVGLIALALTVFFALRQIRKNWRALGQNSVNGPCQRREQLMLAGAVGAVVAFGVHQLTDVPAMMPAIALSGLVALVLAVAPLDTASVKISNLLLGRLAVGGLVGLWGVLLVTGFWSSRVDANYVAALEFVAQNNDYREGANRLQPVIDADPKLSLYQLEKAFLLGMTASSDINTAQAAVEAYRQFIDLDPGYALAWANKAGIEAQLGNYPQAIADMSEASRLDPEVWQYLLNLARYYEVTGDREKANLSYDQVLRVNADASLYPELGTLTERRLLSSVALKLTVPAQVSLLLDGKQIDLAKTAWVGNTLPETTSKNVMEMLLALAANDRAGAVNWLSKAGKIATGNTDEAWLHLGLARLARFDNDLASVERERQVAQTLLVRAPVDSDDEMLLNIAYAQFLRFTLNRQFVPQVDYPVDDPVLLFLLDRT